MDVLATLLINGISNGALFFLIASGLTLIFGLMRVLNFAHGGVYLWGGYVGTFLYTSTHSFLIALLGGAVCGIVIGFVMERGLLQSIYHNETGQVLTTMGIMLVLSELVKIPFGPNELGSPAPSSLAHSWLIHHVVLVQYQVFMVAAGALVYGGLQWLLGRTRLGITIRAGVVNPDLVEARGIPIHRMFTIVFAIGAGLAGLAGALSGPYFGAVTPDMGFNMQLTAFIIVVLGGIGSIDGALIGSIIIGLATAVISYWAPSFAVLVNVGCMALILSFRPKGLLGDREAMG